MPSFRNGAVNRNGTLARVIQAREADGQPLRIGGIANALVALGCPGSIRRRGTALAIGGSVRRTGLPGTRDEAEAREIRGIGKLAGAAEQGQLTALQLDEPIVRYWQGRGALRGVMEPEPIPW